MDRRKRLTLGDVSAHRAVLYGFAALWIAVFHMEYVVPARGLLRLPHLFQELGVGGVEMFVLLTAPGLYRSLEKDPDVCSFYKKRLLRVFLPSAIICGVFYGMVAESTSGWILATLFLPYWLGKWTFWYVAFILTMYLVYPLIYRIQKRWPRGLWALLIASAAFALASTVSDSRWAELCRLGIVRIPVFLLSCLLTPLFERRAAVPRWVMPASLLGSAAIHLFSQHFRYAYYFQRTICHTLLSIFLILFITQLCTHVRARGITAAVYRFFAFCGGISLEIYLLYDPVSTLLTHLPAYAARRIGLLHVELLAFPIALLGGTLLACLCRHLIRTFRAIPVPVEDHHE